MARDKAVLFFGYIFPLGLFFLFARLSNAAQNPGVMAQIIAMTVIIGVLGNGFIGAGMRTVQDREINVLRRFKVAPINALPIIVASIVSGIVNFLPILFLFLFFGTVWFHMPLPPNTASLVIFVMVGLAAFRSVGMVIASVVNSAQEAQVLIQLLYLPMLFLSGATFPVSIMPEWVQQLAQFLPATYLFAGMQSIMIGHKSLVANWLPFSALLITMVVASFVAVKLFRWEKEEKISGRAKLWIAGVLAPFLILGVYQIKSHQSIAEAKVYARDQRRGRSILFQNVRIFIGDGEVIANGAVLIRAGKIVTVYNGAVPNVSSLNAEVRDESGRTLMPGLIDMHVHLGAPGGIYDDTAKYADPRLIKRRLAAYLYCGITAVRSTGDGLDESLALRKEVATSRYEGAELFTYGPLFTAPGGHPTEMLQSIPASFRANVAAQFVRVPTSPSEAMNQVQDLKHAGVDGIKAVLDAGFPEWQVFPRMDSRIYSAVIEEARKQNLPTATHTGSRDDVAEAVRCGTNSVEHGSKIDTIPPSLFAEMRDKQIAYDPTLSLFEGALDARSGRTELLDSPLLQRVGPADLLASTRAAVAKGNAGGRREAFVQRRQLLYDNLLGAYKAGVRLIAGSDAGNLLVIHGPTVQRELELWMQAGIPPAVALKAATGAAAAVLRADGRIGLIKEGRDATFLLLGGDPTREISALERIDDVFFRGEDVDRSELLNQEKQ
jgi:imidazolonepropionase-like amidohydrolase/ABC-type multidrug transport system permease subunit